MNAVNSVIIDGLSFALPLLIIAIGGIYSERSGIINLALEGLLGFGAFSGGLFVAATAGWFAPTSSVPLYVSFAVAAAGGALFAVTDMATSFRDSGRCHRSIAGADRCPPACCCAALPGRRARLRR